MHIPVVPHHRYSMVPCAQGKDTLLLGYGQLSCYLSYLEWMPDSSSSSSSSSPAATAPRSPLRIDFSEICVQGVQTEEGGKRPALFIQTFDPLGSDDSDTQMPTLSGISKPKDSEMDLEKPTGTDFDGSAADPPPDDSLIWFYLPVAQGTLISFLFFSFFYSLIFSFQLLKHQLSSRNVSLHCLHQRTMMMTRIWGA
jgi:hypothetical protein